jgi:AcrR family transcriptional regulator
MASQPISNSPRRSASDDSKNRRALLDAADRLMLAEGYASITARRVAAEAGLKPQLVHYYFSSMDELLISAVKRGADHALKELDHALRSPQPLRALWTLSSNPTGTVLAAEYLALARNRKGLAKEITKAAQRFRQAQHEAVRQLFNSYGIDENALPVGAFLVALAGVARVIVLEDSVGMSTNHAEALALVERELTRLEGPANSGPHGMSSRRQASKAAARNR